MQKTKGQPKAMRNRTGRASRVLVGLGAVLLLVAGLLWTTGTPLSAILDNLHVFVPFVRFDGYSSIQFDGQRAYDHAWAQCNFGPRPPGSQALLQAGDYIIDQLEAQGWVVEEQTFAYQGVTVRNLIGRRGAGTPIIVGAHYDTRGQSQQRPRSEPAG